MSGEQNKYIDDALEYTGQDWIDKVLLHQTGRLEGVDGLMIYSSKKR